VRIESDGYVESVETVLSLRWSSVGESTDGMDCVEDIFAKLRGMNSFGGRVGVKEWVEWVDVALCVDVE
jgi:hypothetical protein